MYRFPLRSAVCLFLAISTTAMPQCALAQQPAREKARAAALRLIPEDADAAIVAMPNQTMAAPSLELMPIEVFSALGREGMGIDPKNIDIIVAAADLSSTPIPVGAVALRLNKPLDPEDIPFEFTGERREEELNGKPYWKTNSGLNYYFSSDKSVVIGFDSMIKKMVAQDKGDSKLKQRLAEGDAANIHVVVMLDGIRDQMGQELARMPRLPGDLEGLKDIPDDVDAIEVRVSAEETIKGALAIHAQDEPAAERIDDRITAAMKTGQQMIMQNMGVGGDDQVGVAMSQYANRMAKYTMDMLTPEVDGSTLVLGGEMNGESQVLVVGALTSLLMPAVGAARQAARRVNSVNSLKMLTLALFNYEAAYGNFPAQAICDDDGEPLLSWRVAILPFIEEQALYEQFNLDEPWDSDHNKKLIPLMPKLFQPQGQANVGKTHFQGLVGEGLFFSGDHEEGGREIREFRDGTSKSMALVEADTSVVWTKPSDFKFDADKPMQNLGNLRKPVFNAAFSDGHVEAISTEVDEEVLKAMVTIDGGEALGF